MHSIYRLSISQSARKVFHYLPLSRSRRYLINGIAGGSILIWSSCGSTGDDNADSAADSPLVVSEENADTAETFVADNDIAMTVRSVADAINLGESLDSADYCFNGVLTDGSGMPLFTDFSGLPGQWQIEVLTPRRLRIRNTKPGNLLPDELVDYLAEALSVIDRNDVKFVEERELGDSSISIYSFGKGNLQITTTPFSNETGEIGPLVEITLQADSVAPADSIPRIATSSHKAPQKAIHKTI